MKQEEVEARIRTMTDLPLAQLRASAAALIKDVVRGLEVGEMELRGDPCEKCSHVRVTKFTPTTPMERQRVMFALPEWRELVKKRGKEILGEDGSSTNPKAPAPLSTQAGSPGSSQSNPTSSTVAS